MLNDVSTAILAQAESLLAQGRAEAALALTAPLASRLPGVDVLSVHAQALKALGRADEALSWDRRTVARFPDARVAWHNLAATLGDLGRGAEAIEATGRAFALGLDGPQTWLVHARALAALGRAEEAVAAYGQVVRRAPLDATPPCELAEVLWTSRADLDGALAVLAGAQAAGASPTLLILKAASVLRAAGRPDAAIAHLRNAALARPHDVAVALALSDALLRRGDAQAALQALAAIGAAHADQPAVLCQLSWIGSALGRGPEALALAAEGLAVDPDAQALLNAYATAGRLTGEPAAGALADYDSLMMEQVIATPPGWPSLPVYLADLSAAIIGLHGDIGHPTEQSLQGGTQTTFRLSGHPDPAIQAFFQAIDAPLRTYMAGLGPGSDPVRRRNTGAYRISGAWSVVLRSGDFHRDHVHTEGWLSSAFYLETPEAALSADGHAGWLRFGHPPFPTATPLPAQRYVRPAPGKLVLFPSYMWHGTEPFTTDERRMTIAFDVVPA